MNSKNQTTRPPIIAVMGHIDHGKSTLLDTIRNTKVAASEAGGITQHVSAYEVNTTSKDGKELRMTFLDTPGHEAFSGIRKRGVAVADIAVLVIAADDGVQPQTKEALDAIREDDIPFIVAINKIDKDNADVERTKQSLLEHDVYLEQFGGSVPAVEISAKAGKGIDDLLEMIDLVAELQELTGDPSAPAQGYVLESGRDPQRGISATLIITNGRLSKGSFVASGACIAPVRLMEDFAGNAIDNATFSSPVKIVGWDKLPEPGNSWDTFETKDEAKQASSSDAPKEENTAVEEHPSEEVDQTVVPIIIKADSGGGIDGLRHELEKLTTDYRVVNVLKADVGNINKNDVMFACASDNALIIGFNVGIDTPAQALAKRDGVEVNTFSVIYDAVDWLSRMIEERTPVRKEKKVIGKATVVKLFNRSKRRQVIGGKVVNGTVKINEPITIYRHDSKIGQGKIINLQHQKEDVSSIQKGMEFGASVEASVEIHAGDMIEIFDIVEI